jgi:osmotically-inducible protein OsmY
MTTSEISLLSAILLGAMLAASTATGSDEEMKNDAVAAPHRDVYLTDFPMTVAVGVVTLTGGVHDWSQKSRATYVAGRARAVREVVNEIQVQPATGTIPKHSDATLAKEIRHGFLRHWTTSPVADRIRVRVKDGVATLTGDLETWDERLEAERVASGTEGVWKVQNRLTVKGYKYEWKEWDEELFPNVG